LPLKGSALEAASELEPLLPDRIVTPGDGELWQDLHLPRHAISLILLTPA
jgi:hypothetical protein